MRKQLWPALAIILLAAGSAGAADDGWIDLFNGKDLTGWRIKDGKRNGWTVIDGVLVNTPPSTNIWTEREFTDFHLHVEFMVPKGSNSGVYLRGRHEVQILDSYGRATAGKGDCGALYGRAAPAVNASRAPGQWQTFDVTLVGPRLTVFHNGICIHNHLDLSSPPKPGPILLQGDHGKVSFRKLKIKPLAPGFAARGKLYVLSSLADDAVVVNLPGHEVVGRIKVGQHPHGIEANAAQDRLYISAELDNLVNVIDTAKDTILQQIPVGPKPNEIAATPDGRLLYVPAGGTGFYEVVDVAAGKIVASIKTGGRPHNVVSSVDGKHMYLSPLGEPRKIFIVETAKHSVVGEIPLADGARPIALRRDEKRLYIERDNLVGFELADVPNRKILHTVPLQLTPEEQQVKSRAHGIGLTLDEKQLWVCDVNHKCVAVFDLGAEPPKQVARIATKTQPYWMTFSPDGRFAYVSNTGADEVQVVDVATRQTVSWIPVGKAPKRLLAVTVRQF